MSPANWLMRSVRQLLCDYSQHTNSTTAYGCLRMATAPFYEVSFPDASSQTRRVGLKRAGITSPALNPAYAETTLANSSCSIANSRDDRRSRALASSPTVAFRSHSNLDRFHPRSP